VKNDDSERFKSSISPAEAAELTRAAEGELKNIDTFSDEEDFGTPAAEVSKIEDVEFSD